MSRTTAIFRLRERRLRLIANNCRFLVLPWGRAPNLASRTLALSTRRLSADMEARFGHQVLLAETFVDPFRFRGTCYRAADWERVGLTRSCAPVATLPPRKTEGDISTLV